MATEIKLPELGEGADSADVVRVMVAPGDDIQENQSIIEVESDKASVEVPSPQAGRVEEVKVSEGDTVSVGQVILTLASGDGAGDAEASEAREEAAESQDRGQAESGDAPTSAPPSGGGDGGGRQTFVLPNLGEGADEGDVVSVLVQVGDSVTKGQSVVEIESDKASVEVPSEVEGEVLEVLVSAGDTVRVGQELIVVRGAASSEAASEDAPKDTPRAAPQAAGSEGPGAASPVGSEGASASTDGRRPATTDGRRPVSAAPSVRTKARELGVDLQSVRGSGPAGRITKDDVERFAQSGGEVSRAAPRSAEGAPSAPREAPEPVAAPAGDRREKMSGIRKTIAQRMTQSWQTIPHVTLYRDVDATDLEALRQRFKGRAEARGTKLTVTAILVKICAAALRKFPSANASVDMDSLEIAFHGDVHVGVAADTERGLVVPVVRDAPTLGIIDIAVRLNELAEKARSGKLAREEMTGATFSISNLGGLGIGFFTPIINPPEVAILGVGRAKEDGQGRLMLPLSLSIDHRALDGADGARFLKWVAEAIEDPMSLLFEG